MAVKIFATTLWPLWLASVYRLSTAALRWEPAKRPYCSANDRKLSSRHQSFDRHVEPFGRFFSIFENANIDGRTLSQ